MSEYRPTGKRLTARMVIEENGLKVSELKSYACWLYDNIPCLTDNLFHNINFLPYALKHPCFRRFLLVGEYIEEVDTWVSPQQGDRYKIRGDSYILARVGASSLILVALSNGNWWTDSVTVKDLTAITKLEFQKICGSIPVDELERIKEK